MKVYDMLRGDITKKCFGGREKCKRAASGRLPD